VLEETPGAIPG
jgi:hypothetical protein